MTYSELLKATGARKREVIRELNTAIRNPSLGFLAKAEIERKPGQVAWLWLAEDFCKAVAEHIDELLESASPIEQDEIMHIYYAYHDEDPEIYDLLPLEAQLFEE